MDSNTEVSQVTLNQVSPSFTVESCEFHSPWNILRSSKSQGTLRACLHGCGGPQVGEVNLLVGVTRLSI